MNKDQHSGEILFTKRWLDKITIALKVIKKSHYTGNHYGTIESPSYTDEGVDEYIPIAISKEILIASLEQQKENWEIKLDKLNQEVPT